MSIHQCLLLLCVQLVDHCTVPLLETVLLVHHSLLGPPSLSLQRWFAQCTLDVHVQSGHSSHMSSSTSGTSPIWTYPLWLRHLTFSCRTCAVTKSSSLLCLVPLFRGLGFLSFFGNLTSDYLLLLYSSQPKRSFCLPLSSRFYR